MVIDVSSVASGRPVAINKKSAIFFRLWIVMVLHTLNQYVDEFASGETAANSSLPTLTMPFFSHENDNASSSIKH